MKIEYTEINDGHNNKATTTLRGSVYSPDGRFMTVSPKALSLELRKDYDADVIIFDKHGEPTRWINGEFTAIILR